MPPDDAVPGSQLAGVIAALDHPTRRRIVAILLVRGTHVSQLARDLEVSRPFCTCIWPGSRRPGW